MHGRGSSYGRGIAIGPILFVIAILAVLVGAISSGSGGFNGSVSPERAKVLATQIINHAQQVKNAVDRVRANGCDDTEISFENGVVSGYTNSNATLSAKPWCHVFQPSGGGITWLSPPKEAVRNTSPYIFTGAMSFLGRDPSETGSGALTSDLILVLPITTSVCDALGRLSDYATPFDIKAWTLNRKFAGAYSWYHNYPNAFVRSHLWGCVTPLTSADPSSELGQPQFYMMLAVR